MKCNSMQNFPYLFVRLCSMVKVPVSIYQLMTDLGTGMRRNSRLRRSDLRPILGTRMGVEVQRKVHVWRQEYLMWDKEVGQAATSVCPRESGWNVASQVIGTWKRTVAGCNAIGPTEKLVLLIIHFAWIAEWGLFSQVSFSTLTGKKNYSRSVLSLP